MKDCVAHDLHKLLKYCDEYLYNSSEYPQPSNCSLIRVDEAELTPDILWIPKK